MTALCQRHGQRRAAPLSWRPPRAPAFIAGCVPSSCAIVLGGERVHHRGEAMRTWRVVETRVDIRIGARFRGLRRVALPM